MPYMTLSISSPEYAYRHHHAKGSTLEDQLSSRLWSHTRNPDERTVAALFTASESFDVGMDKGSGVAMEYHDKIPFKFNGKINIKYIE